MEFLIEVKFRKGSEIGIMLSKLKKLWKLQTFVGNSMEFILLFPQLRFEYFIVSTRRSFEVLFFLFCCFMDLSVSLMPIPTKMQLSLQSCLLKIPKLVNMEFSKAFSARKKLKYCTKNDLKM